MYFSVSVTFFFWGGVISQQMAQHCKRRRENYALCQTTSNTAQKNIRAKLGYSFYDLVFVIGNYFFVLANGR